MGLLVAPLRALVAFFHISVGGALGYCIGVIGCVLIPGAYVGLRKLDVKTPIAAPVAAIGGIYAGGIVLALFVGGFGFGGFDDVETHAIAIARLNDCAPATAAIGAPIEQTGTGGGTYESRGAFGTSTWEIDVAGSKRGAVVRYAAEKHGGTWQLTALQMKVDDRVADLASCMRGRAAPAPRIAVRRAEVVGLWAEEARGDAIVLTRIADDGSFVSAAFRGDEVAMKFRGTWELSDGAIVWHFDKAASQAPEAVWEAMGSDRIAADVNPIVEVGATKLVFEEMDGRRSELVAVDPARVAAKVQQLDAK